MKNFDARIIKVTRLLNGENPYQVPADLFHTDSRDKLAIGKFKQVAGEAPCYTNIADFDSILKVLCSLYEAFDSHYGKVPYIVAAAKHGNPCGLSVNWNSKNKAIEDALWGNPLAIWGGEVITNFSISGELAEKLKASKKRERLLKNPNWMLDLVVAPDFDKQSIKILSKNPRRKMFKNKVLRLPYLKKGPWSYRIIRGGFLRQPPNNYILDLKASDFNFSFPKTTYLDSLIIAWAAAWFSNHGGNEVAIAKDRKLVGAGGGPATVESCYTTIIRAKRCGHYLKDSVFAADAFFPFTDGPRELIKAGCIYGVVPAGGKNFELVKNYFKKNKVYVFYLPEQFRGFCRH